MCPWSINYVDSTSGVVAWIFQRTKLSAYYIHWLYFSVSIWTSVASESDPTAATYLITYIYVNYLTATGLKILDISKLGKIFFLWKNLTSKVWLVKVKTELLKKTERYGMSPIHLFRVYGTFYEGAIQYKGT